MKKYTHTFKRTNISYTLSGRGSVVVWLHGFMENKSIWEAQLIYFDNYFTNICVDLLGHGETGNICEVESYSMKLQAESVLSLLDHLKINTYSVVGHSMGGYVGLGLMDVFPEKIVHFVLLNSTSLPDTIERKNNRLRAIKIIEKQKETYCRLGVVNLFAKKSRDLYPLRIEGLINIAQKTSAKGIKLSLLGMMERGSKQQLLKEYKGRKLIVSGVSDPIIPTDVSREEAQFVHAHFKTLEGGHMTYIESGDQLNIILEDFLLSY